MLKSTIDNLQICKIGFYYDFLPNLVFNIFRTMATFGVISKTYSASYRDPIFFFPFCLRSTC